MATVELMQAIWLSLNVDPGSAERKDGRIASEAEAEKAKTLWVNACARFDMAVSHAKSRSLKIEADLDHEPDRWQVRLADFRAWGEALPSPLAFPDEFPKSTMPEPAAPVTNEPAKKNSLGSRERNNLLRIIRALDAMNPRPLPQTGYAESIRAALDGLGLTAVSDDTIRKVIDNARKLDS